MPRLFHHSLHFEYTLFPKKLRWLFVSHLLRGGASQLASMFIPLYLFTRAQSIGALPFFPAFATFSTLQKGMIFICGYFFLLRLTTLLSAFPVSRLMRLLGLTKSMMVGNLLVVGMFLSLFASDKHPLFLALAAVLAGLDVMFYWVSYYTDFSVQADLSKIGQEVGSVQFLERLFRASMPLIGGTIAGLLGFGSLHLVSASIFVFATVFLLLVREVKFSYTVSIREFLRWMQEKTFARTAVGFAGKYLDEAGFLVWPVFIFLLVGQIERVGFIFSLILFLSLAISYFMGWYLGKHKGRRLFYLSGSVLGLVWIARAFVVHVWHIIAVDLTDRLSIGVYQPIFDTVFLRRARGKNVFHFQVYREVVNSIVALATWILIVLFFMLPYGWEATFLLASIGIFLSMVINGEAAHEL